MVALETEVFVLGPDGSELLRAVLAPGEYVIGRTDDCALRVEADLVSRKHARLIIKEDSVIIEDLGSSNGTFVNGQAVTDFARLWPNQKIQVGAATISVRRKKLPGDSEPPPNAAAVRRLLPEELLRDKKYDIGREVAKGGMGAILSAQEGAIRREVAMKVMLGRGDEDDLLRFVEEAQITGQLEHPNIVPVHELGVDENDQLFYTMKMVRGITLKKVLELLAQNVPATVQKYPLVALLTIFQKVCDAIAFAHAKGVLHRDLKPENIMLGGYGEVLVMDWGLAKIIGAVAAPGEAGGAVKNVVLSVRRDADAGGMTMAGTIMGTPQYMSPEQARGEIETLDARSDIYSLGAILFQILALRPPVMGKTAMEIVEKVARGEVESLGAAVQGRRISISRNGARPAKAGDGHRPPLQHLPGGLVPDSLAAVVGKAMDFDPTARYENVSSLQADIAAFQGGFATSAEHAGPWKQARLFVARNRGVSIAIAAALALMGALGGVHTVHLERERGRAEAQKKRAVLGEQRAEEALAAANNALLRGKLEKAQTAFDQGRADEGIVWLAAALRQEPAHPTAGAWLLSALTERNFVIPAAPRIDLEKIWDRQDEFSAALFSADGRRLLLGARVAGLSMWDVETSQRVWQWADRSGDVKRVLFTPDGREIAVVIYGGERTVRFFDAETGAVLRRTALHETDPHHLAFTPDGRTLISADAKAIYFWDASTGAPLGERIPVPISPDTIQVSADGRWLAARFGGSTPDISVWDLRTRKLAQPPLAGANGWPKFHPTIGSRLFVPAGVKTNRSWIYDVATGAVVDTDEQHGTSANTGMFSPTGLRFVTANTGNDYRARLWETRRGAPRSAWLKHAGPVSATIFSPEGMRFFTSGQDFIGRLWSARTGEPVAEPWRMPDGPFSPSLARWSPDGTRLVLPNRRHSAQVYDVRDGRQQPQILKTVSSDCSHLVFAPDGKWLAVSGPTGARLYDASSHEMLGPEMPHAKRLNGLVVSADGRRLATCSEDGTARVWDTATRQPLTPPLVHGERSVLAVAFDPTERLLATACADQEVRVWDAVTGQRVGESMKLSTPSAHRLVFSPDGGALAVCNDHQTTVFDPRTGQRLVKIGREGPHRDARFSADGRLLAVATEREGVWVFNTATWQEAYPTLPHGNIVRTVRFSPDGARLLTACEDATARLWNARTGELLLAPLPHPEPLKYALFSPDGARLATTARDNTLRLWDVASGAPLSMPLWHAEDIVTLAFSPDGTRLMTSHGNGYLNFWDVPPVPPRAPAWLPALAEAVAGRRFSERGEFVPVGEGEFWNLRMQIRATGAAQDYFTRWAAWFFADRTTRPGTPWSVAPATDALNRQNAWLLVANIDQAIRRRPSDATFLVRMGHHLLANVKTVPFAETDAEYLLAAAAQLRLEKQLADKRAAGVPAFTAEAGLRGFPARDPAATHRELDLTLHYTCVLDVPLHGDDGRLHLGRLPTGLQTFGGVRWDVRGVAHLWGKKNSYSKPHPLRIEGIPVDQTVKRLHVLHAAGYTAPTGTKVATWVWHYFDGESREVPVLFGEDLAGWTDTAPATRAKEVWSSPMSNSQVRLFHRAFDNPRPDEPVATLELVSAREDASLFVVAATVE